MDARASLDIWVRDRTPRVLVSATESFQPVQLTFSQIPGKERGTQRQGGCESGCHCLSVFASLGVWTHFCVCCWHHLMARSFCTCFHHLGLFCI